MENTVQQNSFEIRHHQIYIEVAENLKVTDLLRDSNEDGIAISKADIILIFTLFEEGVKEYYRLYMQYVRECKDKRFRAVHKPHWHLKQLIDDKY
ncbi:MAG: hypothetical protein ACRC28_18900 [Clostridium sp.]|uniref:hypothetical protein n=1 Tax=Clostridium sp. TaxID=1506 RepID=UPI003F2EDD58